MKEQIIYRKVFIRGEEDLPSKEARYFVGHKMGGQLADWFIPEHEIGNKYWLDNYDWYLLPVSLPTEKEIHEAAYNACVKPSMPNGEPEPEHAFYDAFVQCADWLKRQITSK